jgi:hypothetical protein
MNDHPRPVPPLGQNSRLFPWNREFCRFAPRNRRLSAKTVRQIKPLPVNSRSTDNREFIFPQRNYPRQCSGLGIVPRRPSTKRELERDTPLRPIENVNPTDGAIVPRQLAFCEADQPRDHGERNSGSVRRPRNPGHIGFRRCPRCRGNRQSCARSCGGAARSIRRSPSSEPAR